VTLLSDRLGEAARGFDVLGEAQGIPRAARSAFLVDGAAVRAAWHLGRELPDVDAVIAEATG
jgi:peroxiredoxin